MKLQAMYKSSSKARLTGRMLLIGVLILGYSAVLGQKSMGKIKIYKVSLTTVAKSKVRGFMSEVGDSSIVILSGKEKIEVPSSAIDRIAIYAKGHTGRGALAGGAIGVGLGLIIGYASGDDECPQGSLCLFQMSAEEKALSGAILLGASGTLVGLAIGSTTKAENISIQGDMSIFYESIDLLRKYIMPAETQKGAP